MKKNIVILLVSLFVGSALNAQGIDFGAKAGYLYSDMNVKEVKDFKSIKSKAKGGYLLGVFGKISGKTFFFQPEIQYRARTNNFELSKAVVTNEFLKPFLEELSDKVSQEIEVSYKTLDIPLQVGVKALNLPLVKICIHGGPVASIKLDESVELKDTPILTKKYIKENFKDYNAFVWSGQLGVSVDVARFVLDLSYEKGFSDIAKRGIGKNDLFIATVGIKLF